LLCMGRSRYKVVEPYPHFITCTVANWLSLFSQPELTEIVISSLRFLRPENRLTLYAYVVMENHMHLIATATNLAKAMQSFKSFSAKQIVRSLSYVDEPWHWRYSSARNYTSQPGILEVEVLEV
jgi:putative transposase